MADRSFGKVIIGFDLVEAAPRDGGKSPEILVTLGKRGRIGRQRLTRADADTPPSYFRGDKTVDRFLVARTPRREACRAF